jgi:hypothetical protein
MVLICPWSWRLGAGAPITVLQFAPFCGCARVLGLSMRFGACSWFKHIEVRFGEPETTSLKEENGRRPIFFIFWPNEVS